LLEGALALASAVVALTLLLIVLILVLRWRRVRLQRHIDSFEARWRPILMAAVLAPTSTELPMLAARDQFAFLRLWNYLHESLHGEASQHLNVLARRLKCDAAALRMLHGRGRAARQLAILTLGHLREPAAWHALRGAAASADTMISLLAARALIQIDTRGGAESLLPLMLSRGDWDIARLALVLARARDAFGTLIAEAMPRLAAPSCLRALKLIEALRADLPEASSI
jgi:hypothetical protein